MNYKFFIIIFLFFSLNACGFKLKNLNNNYNITDLQTSGDKKINYKIKNKILNSSRENGENLITISIDTKKQKIIKEKNISNQITKYEIKIISSVELQILGDKNTTNKFSILKSGDYNVSSKYSNTLITEKSLVDTLVNDIIEDILENITSELNDL